MDEGGWISLNGCNACINSLLCGKLGNCALLTIDKHLPNSKKKRKLITRLRTYCNDHQIVWLKEMVAKHSGVSAKQDKDEWAHVDAMVKENCGNVNLTRIEKLFLESLNKKR